MDDEDFLDFFLLSGAVEVAGVNESGEFLYNITPKMKDILPDIYDEHLKAVNHDIMNLWEKGYLDVDLTEENPLVRLTDKCFDDNSIKQLSIDEASALKEITRLLSN